MFNNTRERRRRKKEREVSMSDVMPKFDNTMQMKMEASAANFQRLLALANSTIGGPGDGKFKLSFIDFLKVYPYIEDLSFIGFFTVQDLVAMRLLCRDANSIFNDDV